MWENNTELVNLLLKEGANVNAPGSDKGSALELAIEKEDITIVQLMLQAGAEVNVPERSWTPSIGRLH